MVVTCTGSEAAAYCGTRLLAELTSLQKQNKNQLTINLLYTQATITVVSWVFATDRSLE